MSIIIIIIILIVIFILNEYFNYILKSMNNFYKCPSGAMDSASDFGSGGCGFESHLGLFFVIYLKLIEQLKKYVSVSNM